MTVAPMDHFFHGFESGALIGELSGSIKLQVILETEVIRVQQFWSGRDDGITGRVVEGGNG